MKIILRILILIVTCSSTLVGQETEVGLASFYSDKFHGKPTASGELYDRTKLTGAHKTFEFNDIIKVTRLDNGKSVRIRINDRGPFISGRVVDLSKAAADKIGLTDKEGVVEVRIEKIGAKKEEPKEAVAKKEEPKEEVKNYEEETSKIASADTTPKKTETKPKKAATKPKSTPKPSVKKTPKTVVATTEKAAERMSLVKGNDFLPYDLYKIQLLRPEKKGFGVQVASMGNIENVFRQIAELQGEWFKNILLNIEQGADGNPVYKIILGPFPDEATANSYKQSLKKKKISGFVVNLEGV